MNEKLRMKDEELWLKLHGQSLWSFLKTNFILRNSPLVNFFMNSSFFIINP